MVAEAGTELDDALARALDDRPEVRFHRRVEAGTALRVLMDHAASARMIVVGQRDERAPVGEMLLGSTSRGLVEFAPCPFVVLPTAAARGTNDLPAAVHGH
ncbi:universal stress protein [Pseudonocardia lacus]|uniref:universal stress protein n=1 Tax=Pseudonocardia lacus TaxID=2835865 RepID=UPI001BDCDAE0